MMEAEQGADKAVDADDSVRISYVETVLQR